MKKNEKPSKSPASSTETNPVGKPAATSQAKEQSPTANDLGQGVDRPGFDLGGSSGDSHAGTAGRNSTPSLNAIMEESRSSVAAVPYPVAYAFMTILALIGGYFSMILS